MFFPATSKVERRGLCYEDLLDLPLRRRSSEVEIRGRTTQAFSSKHWKQIIFISEFSLLIYSGKCFEDQLK